MDDSLPGSQEDSSPSVGLYLPPGSFGTPLHLDLALQHVLNASKYRGAIFTAFGLLVGLMVGLIWLAFRLPPETFFKELSVVLAAGIGTFLGTPIVVKLSTRQRPYVIPLVLLLSVCCLIVAAFEEAPLRGLLIEGSVSLILIVSLEIFFHHAVKGMRRTYEAAEAQRENELDRREQKLQDAMDDWDRDHKVIGHGFGAIDQFETPPTPGENKPKDPEQK